jgi:hypothetical protein
MELLVTFGVIGAVLALVVVILLLTFLGGVIFGNMDELDEDF